MFFNKYLKLVAVAVSFGGGAMVQGAIAADVGIIASLSPKTQNKISMAVNTESATKGLIAATANSNNIYWLERKNSSTYHTTLDLIHNKNGNFTANDYTHIEDILINFGTHAKNLNSANNKGKKGNKFYPANGYELRLFVHYTDGTHAQLMSKNINSLYNSNKDIAYANLVLKLGTHKQLNTDWEWTQKNILTKPGHSQFSRCTSHKLETHITIANLFKYTKKQNQIVNGQMQRKNGKSPINTPFNHNDKSEMKILVKAFKQANSKFKTLNGIKIDRFQITQLQNGQLNTIKTVIF